MISLINLAVLFVAKVADNALSTTKTILVQRSRWILAGIAVIISDFIYFWITKRVVSANNEIAMLVVAVAGGVGCSLACFINERKLFHFSYQRYLENRIRETFGLEGTPIRMIIRERGEKE